MISFTSFSDFEVALGETAIFYTSPFGNTDEFGYTESYTFTPNEDNTLLTVYYEDLRWTVPDNGTGYTNKAYYTLITKDSDAHVPTTSDGFDEFILYINQWETTEGEGVHRNNNHVLGTSFKFVYMGDDE